MGGEYERQIKKGKKKVKKVLKGGGESEWLVNQLRR